jgi:hypothetical protein
MLFFFQSLGNLYYNIDAVYCGIKESHHIAEENHMLQLVKDQEMWQ